ncbi:MAG: hypothetical protein IPL52_18180 [Flavobacteriales bacterium]|nr:hypothetical protein [Flavobacteriales bacterium]
MNRPLSILMLGFVPCVSIHAQLINGSFEDGQGNFDNTGWTSTCPMVWGPAAPGYGDFGALVNHSNAGCNGWSRATHLVPEIANGETWTLGGWCGVFTFPFFSPYVGFGLGWKEADGTLHFFTAPVTNNGTYTYLQVTNTFALAPGDTAFVELDPGTASGGSGNSLFAMYDGLELANLTTGSGVTFPSRELALRTNVAQDQLWLGCDEAILAVQLVELGSGRSVAMPISSGGTTIEVDLRAFASGAYAVIAGTASGSRIARFVKF